jgi:lysophospholipase L1-like esterase
MEHLEAHNQQMATQANLPEVGTAVTVEKWHSRGYVHRLLISLITAYPHVDFASDNFGEGGATSRDVLANIRAAEDTQRWDVAVLGCGINDVWRGLQGRTSEAVNLEEFTQNYRAMIELLTERTRRVLCVGEPPFGWEPLIDAAAANVELIRYNQSAAELATAAGIEFVDVWAIFVRTAQMLSRWTPTAPIEPDGLSPWSDGVHLSEVGDDIMRKLIETQLAGSGGIERLTSCELPERQATPRH